MYTSFIRCKVSIVYVSDVIGYDVIMHMTVVLVLTCIKQYITQLSFISRCCLRVNIRF